MESRDLYEKADVLLSKHDQGDVIVAFGNKPIKRLMVSTWKVYV